MNYLLPERLDRLAREYALGTLHGGARRRFARVVAEESAAARAVAMWQLRLAVLAPVTSTMEPRPQAWEGVQRRLFGATPAPALAAGREPAAPPRARSGSRVLGGRFGWLPGLALGVVLAIVAVRWQPQWLGVEPANGGAPPEYVGVLDDAQGRALVVTSARRHGTKLTVRLLHPIPLANGQVLQLWAWNDAGVAPVPVVAWASPGTSTLDLPGEAEPLLGKMTHLGVSVEAHPAAAGASAPATFVAQGHCAKLW
jgi:anti-sigma-K factor RskA